ncbi:MAG: 5-deoxy-glucuronate isomerase [Actinomycetota bacterium]|nr:5-deoxy-glucuronate isomerase [Actinomycetota bacterium]
MALVNVIPDLGGSFEYLIRAGPRGRIGVARGRGSATGSTGAAFAWLMIEGGEGQVVAGTVTSDVGGRDDVFDGSGWSVFIGPKTRFEVRGHLRYAIMGRSWTTKIAPRVVEAADVQETSGVEGSVVRTYLPEGPLACGETVHAPGGWASWRAHTREQESVFLYRLSHDRGFAVQILDTKEGGRRAELVTDGEVRRIRSGKHPVVAGPVGAMVTVWALAGREEASAADLVGPSA